MTSMASKLLNDDDDSVVAVDFGELPEERHALYFIMPSSAMAMMMSSSVRNNLLFIIFGALSLVRQTNDENQRTTRLLLIESDQVNGCQEWR